MFVGFLKNTVTRSCQTGQWVRLYVIRGGLGIAALLSCGLSPAQDPRQGDLFKVVLKNDEKDVVIPFRYCPAGHLRPGKPKEKAVNPVAIDPFYFSETELTIEQFSAVVDRERFEKLHRRMAAEPGFDNKILEQQSLPVFNCTLDDLIALCQRLDTLASTQLQDGISEIERWRFRIPTHHEWQYASRARVNPDIGPPRPHFARWVDDYRTLDNIAQAKCLEEWKLMGRSEADFTGSQQQIEELLQARVAQENPKPLEILSAFLSDQGKVVRNYAINLPGQLRSIRNAGKNEWDIYDTQDNLREWTIRINNRGEAQQFWERLISAPQQLRDADRADQRFFLAGGSFVDIMTGEPGQTNAWMKFTIWGGFPFDSDLGDVYGFSINDIDEKVEVSEQIPGVRLLAERVLVDDWIFVVRQKVVTPNRPAENIANVLKTYQKTIDEIVPQDRRRDFLVMLNYYKGLGLYRLGRYDEAIPMLADTRDVGSAVAPSSQIRPKLNPADFFGRTKKKKVPDGKSVTSTVKQETDDNLFFETLAYLAKKDGASKE